MGTATMNILLFDPQELRSQESITSEYVGDLLGKECVG